ncbi:MAG TPA: hypothetical protein VHY09_12395 [Candidatus Methylacidiphilales bacterium]|jgi:hypothetical protein|nr:hypothetical protein [Candidatus Methylacidiphilales bacterium]
MNAGPSSDRHGGEFHPGADLDPRHEAVERLLGRAPMPVPDAWFAARTLARCRSEKREAVSLTQIWRWVLGGGLGICLAVSLLVVQVTQNAPVQAQNADQQKSVQEAFEIMASSDNSDNDTSASSASSTSWQDSSL